MTPRDKRRPPPPLLIALYRGDPDRGGREVPDTRRVITVEDPGDGLGGIVVEAVRWTLGDPPADRACILSPGGLPMFDYRFPVAGHPGQAVTISARSLRVPLPTIARAVNDLN